MEGAAVVVAPPARDGAPKSEKPPAPTPAEVPLSPAVRRLVAAKGVDVTGLTGTGPRGRITESDVLAHVEKQQAEPSAPSPSLPPTDSRAAPAQGGESRQRMSTLRQRIAERLVAARQTAAILTTFNEADLSAVNALRASYKESFQKKHGVPLGFMSFFVKACVEALRAYPVVNAWIEGSDIVYHDACHVSVAVSTEKGLMVPVVRNAEQLSFAEIEQRIAELAQKARDGKISVSDLQGGTFTITNGGVFGSLLSTPILNPPQSAILGMHTIQKRPVAVGDQVVIRPMMYLALSYDHRLIDGREAVSFLVRIKECIEHPERMLLAV
jgi:2-oxoglutarate dehydrogenase E2 component (dihydrolipoamide succinyltransferase)